MKAILITTTTCPKCPEVKKWVAKNMPETSVFDEQAPGFSDVLAEYSVTAAPTLILFDNDENEIFRGNEVSEFEDFLSVHSVL